MKIILSLSGEYTGSKELSAITDNQPIPLVKVRIRCSFLKLRIVEYKKKIEFFEKQSDYSMVKELEDDIQVMNSQVKLLQAIKTQRDRGLYLEYCRQFHDIKRA